MRKGSVPDMACPDEQCRLRASPGRATSSTWLLQSSVGEESEFLPRNNSGWRKHPGVGTMIIGATTASIEGCKDRYNGGVGLQNYTAVGTTTVSDCETSGNPSNVGQEPGTGQLMLGQGGNYGNNKIIDPV